MTGLVTEHTFVLEEEDGDDWSDTWINPFSQYGLLPSNCLSPPPKQKHWHPIAKDGDRNDLALRAIEEENVAVVRDFYKTPKYLLRWRSNTFTCGNVVGFTFYENVLH